MLDLLKRIFGSKEPELRLAPPSVLVLPASEPRTLNFMASPIGRVKEHLVVPKDSSAPYQKIGFRHKLSAETYITHRGLQDSMKIETIWVFDEFDDAIAHLADIERQEALKKLSRAERLALGIKE